MKKMYDLLSGKEKIKVAEITANNLTLPWLKRDDVNHGIEFGTIEDDIDIYIAEALTIYNESSGTQYSFHSDGSFECEVEIMSPIITAQAELKMPLYTTALRPTSQDEGSIIYDSTLKKCILYNGTAWVNLDGTALA